MLLRLGQHLDRFDAAQQLVLRLEHVPHAALADRVHDAIRPEREFRAPFLELLDLPAIQVAQIDQPLAEHFVGDLLGGERRRPTRRR